MSRYFLIDPDAKLDYTEDWSDWLDAGIEIDSVVWSIDPTGPTLSNQTNTITAATTFVEGCTVGVVYRLSCKITTTATFPQTDERTVAIRCEQK